MDAARPAQELAGLKPPILTVQGDADTPVTWPGAQRLLAARPDAARTAVKNLTPVLKAGDRSRRAAYTTAGPALAPGLGQRRSPVS